jgi:hypothetical protein
VGDQRSELLRFHHPTDRLDDVGNTSRVGLSFLHYIKYRISELDPDYLLKTDQEVGGSRDRSTTRA